MAIDIPTSIINLSLGMLNVSPLVDINSDEPDSIRIREQVKISREVALAEHSWGFARKKLARESLLQENGFYVLPVDFIQALCPKIEEEYSRKNTNTNLYERLVRFSYYDGCAGDRWYGYSEILYIFNAPYELWDKNFTNFFIKKLAYDVAILFGKDPQKLQLLAGQIESERLDISRRYSANYRLKVDYGNDCNYNDYYY